MEKIHKILLAAGALICILLFWIDIYLGATGVIVLVALAMSVFIMEDSRVLPELMVRLGDDAKKVVVENSGNAPAYRIHVALVPLDIEFDLPELVADARYEYPLTRMIEEAKAAVTFDDAKGVKTSRTFTLSALGKGDDDLLKPMFPLFKWK
ncbi:MAG: hypothetical protein ABR999_10160 [Methanoregula sp.]|jgi:hypothetical protein|uniref:hypothetical protein n=1 Tax=Methanoregula sp. TaxID=2052170 RepID=UPI003D149745